MIDKNKIITTITECVLADRYVMNEVSIKSFEKNLRLYKKAVINLDVYDEKSLGPTKDMFAKYFDCEFIISYEPHFTKAINSVWSHPVVKASEYIFHFETDWELLNNPNERLCLLMLENRSYLDSLNLRAYSHLSSLTCLSPCWLKNERVQKWLPIPLDYNPEFYIHFTIHSRGCHRPNYTIIKDLGREFMKNKDMKRTQQKYFVKWVTRCIDTVPIKEEQNGSKI